MQPDLKGKNMTAASSTENQGWLNRSLNTIERVGNKLPDPALLFAMFMVAVWIISWALSGVTFDEIDPRSGKPIQVINLLDGASFTAFMAKLVNTFVSFPPLGVVLVAMHSQSVLGTQVHVPQLGLSWCSCVTNCNV